MKRALSIILLAVFLSGCVDMLQGEEVLVDSSWHGRVVDLKGEGIPGVPVTLHVMGDRGEVYSRSVNTSGASANKGAYCFEHIEVRPGATYGYTTCNLTVRGETIEISGKKYPLMDESKKEVATICQNGRNITAVIYRTTIKEILVSNA